ncbi:hypothetical protein NSPZN2_11220 [Nitrospira defluvii]|uniref:Uncharacterized protein n=1 Tax=Nitrospira defluvii TaxID=330214 RepID=A0ABM8QR92_9BACT|nr:hypothetical protein NSPZN2_11220 [Nitrospira defluvii]
MPPVESHRPSNHPAMLDRMRGVDFVLTRTIILTLMRAGRKGGGLADDGSRVLDKLVAGRLD